MFKTTKNKTLNQIYKTINYLQIAEKPKLKYFRDSIFISSSHNSDSFLSTWLLFLQIHRNEFSQLIIFTHVMLEYVVRPRRRGQYAQINIYARPVCALHWDG